MNSQHQSPLMPQGIPLDPKNRGRARVKIAVFFVLAVHGIGLMALLMQGCRREEAPPVPSAEMDTNVITAPTLDDTNVPPPIDTNVAAPLDTNMAPVAAPVDTAPTPAPGQPPAGTSEYKVMQGDSFYSIAKKFNITMKAVADANPSVNPNKLQIGQTLVIPAPTEAATTDTAAPAPATADGTVYTVKSGDNLTKIASQFGVSVKAIRSANNLQTDRITVGQKLKIPSKQ